MIDRRTLVWSIKTDNGITYGGEIGKERERGDYGKWTVKSGTFDPTRRMLSIDYSREKSKKGICKFDLYNEDLAYFMGPIFAKNQTLRFQFGYMGQTSEMLVGKITGIKGFTKLEVEVTLEEGGFDFEQKERVWIARTRSQIATAIAQENGFNRIVVEETKDLSSYTQDSVTDREFLLQIAEKIGFTMFTRIESGVPTLHFHKRSMDEAPTTEFVWRGGVGDLKDFDITENSLLGVPQEVEVEGFDEEERQMVSATGRAPKNSLGVTSEIANMSLETGAMAPGTQKQTKTTLKVPSSVSSMGEAQEEADGIMADVNQTVIKAKAKLVGSPRLDQGMSIKITGMPTMLGGNYYIEKIGHKLDSGGFETELQLLRTGWGSPTSEDSAGGADGSPNRKSVGDKKALSGVSLESGGEGFKFFKSGK